MNTDPSGHRADDETALEAVFRCELPDVFRYAASRVGPIEAEDVVADVFHAAAVAFGDGRRHQVNRAWLFAVARNSIIDRWRRASRRKALVHLAFNGRNHEVEFPSDWTEDPRREAVLRALGKLKPRHRTLLTLHHIDGLSIRELAAAAAQSEHAIESALARARSAFRRHYQGDTDG